MDIATTKRKAVALVGEVDQNELAVRLIEAHAGVRRPPDKTAKQCLEDMGPQIANTAIIQAHAALQYIAECLAKGERPQ